MVFSLTLLQHRAHGDWSRWVLGLLPSWAREAIERGHVAEWEWVVKQTNCPKNGRFDLHEMLASGMSKRGSGLLLVRGGTDAGDSGILVAHKFSPLLQYQSVLTVSTSGGSRARARTVKVSCVSCSIVPPWVPFSALFALLLFWVPFSDQGANAEYLRAFHRDVLLNIPELDASTEAALVLPPPPAPAVVQPSSSLVFFSIFILLPILSAAYAVLFLVAV